MSTNINKQRIQNVFNSIIDNDLNRLKSDVELIVDRLFLLKKTQSGTINGTRYKKITMLHLVLYCNSSHDMINYITGLYIYRRGEIPYKELRDGDNKTPYDIALETKKDINIIEVFITDSIREELYTVYQPALKDAIDSANLAAIEKILEEHPTLIKEHISAGTSIMEYAIKGSNKDVVDIIIKYMSIYKQSLKSYDYYFKFAVKARAAKDIIEMFKPADVLNASLLKGYTSSPLKREEKASPFSEFSITNIEGIDVITILKGTLLFNGYTVTGNESNINPDYSANNTYLQLLNGILPLGTKIKSTETTVTFKGCLDKSAAKFFFSNPAGSPAFNQFNTLAMFELKEDIRVAVLMTPSNINRLSEIHQTGNSLIEHINKCNVLAKTYKIPAKCEMCKCSCIEEKGTYRCPHTHGYDVCLSPDFMEKYNIQGHITIAAADTYSERLQEFDKQFAENKLIPLKYKQLNKFLFKYGSSIDIRKSPINNTEETLAGFPEIVLQLYDTRWYKDSVSSLSFEKTVDIKESIEKTIIDFLLNANVHSIFDETRNLLSLCCVSTTRSLYNFKSGEIIESPYLYDAIISEFGYSGNMSPFFYLNYLEAILNGQLECFIDPRTGFLVRAGISGPLFSNSDTKRKTFYIEDFINKSNDDSAKSLLEKSGAFREKFTAKKYINQFLIMPHDFEAAEIKMSGGGPLQTERLRSHTTMRSHRKHKSHKKSSQTIQKIAHTFRKLGRTVHSYARRKKSVYKTPEWIDTFYNKCMALIKSEVVNRWTEPK